MKQLARLTESVKASLESHPAKKGGAAPAATVNDAESTGEAAGVAGRSPISAPAPSPTEAAPGQDPDAAAEHEGVLIIDTDQGES